VAEAVAKPANRRRGGRWVMPVAPDGWGVETRGI
jgi:hypothetical protein